jgi:hypothetical protein
MSCYYRNNELLRENPDTANAGNKWEIEDDAKLRQYIQENKSYEEMAFKFKRTLSSITLRILNNIILPEYNGLNYKELIEKYNIKNIGKFEKLTKMKDNQKKMKEEWNKIEDENSGDSNDTGVSAVICNKDLSENAKPLDEYEEYRIKRVAEIKQRNFEKRELKLSGCKKYHELLTKILERLDRIEKRLEGYDFTETEST